MRNCRCSVAKIYVAAQFVFSDTEKHVTTQEQCLQTREKIVG